MHVIILTAEELSNVCGQRLNKMHQIVQISWLNLVLVTSGKCTSCLLWLGTTLLRTVHEITQVSMLYFSVLYGSVLRYIQTETDYLFLSLCWAQLVSLQIYHGDRRVVPVLIFSPYMVSCRLLYKYIFEIYFWSCSFSLTLIGDSPVSFYFLM